MVLYLLQLLLFISYSFFFLLLSGNNRLRFLVKTYLSIIVIHLSLFSGLRGINVGTDTQMYVNGFINNVSIDENTYTYNFLRSIIWMLSKDNYHIFLIVIALITNYCVVFGIYRISSILQIDNKIKFIFASVTNYILYDFYLASFNTARQFLAVAICFLAMTYLTEHRYLIYAVLEVLAIGVHNTAIFTVILIFAVLLKKNYRNLTMLAFLAILMNYFSTSLIQVFTHYSDHYKLYTADNINSMSSNGGMLLIGVFFLIINIIGLTSIKKNDLNEKFLDYIYIAILGSLMYIVGMKSQMFLRIALYASIFNVVSVPIATASYTKRNIILYRDVELSWIVELFIFSVGFVIYCYMLQNNLGGIVPYSLD